MDEDLKLVSEARSIALSAFITAPPRLLNDLADAVERLHGCRTAHQDTIDALTAEIEALKSDVSDLIRAGSDEATENERLVKERDEALFQAESIANYTAAFYGPPENWKPMTGDLSGLLSQISNAVTGLALASRAETAEAQRDAALEALFWIGEFSAMRGADPENVFRKVARNALAEIARRARAASRTLAGE